MIGALLLPGGAPRRQMLALGAGTGLLAQLVQSSDTVALVAALPPSTHAVGTAGACALAFAAALTASRRRAPPPPRSKTARNASSGDGIPAALAVEELRRERVRFLRAKLLDLAKGLGNDALRPAAGPAEQRRAADTTLDELLSLALPPDAAVAATRRAAPLEGAWTLVYTTRGTVVTRAAESNANLLSVFDIRQVLDVTAAASKLSASNAASIRVGPSVWRLKAVGDWVEASEGSGDAEVTFTEFGIEPLELFGTPVDGAPALRVPVPQPMRRSALFRTLYLDGKLRVAEGAQSGNRFVFVRDKQGR